jgi:hypothetical protein
LIVGQRVDKRVRENVFEAAFGFFLQDELRRELHWISGRKLLSTSTVINVKLSPIADQGDHVKVRMTVRQQVRNIAPEPEEMLFSAVIPQSSVGTPATFTECQYQLEGRPVDDVAQDSERTFPPLVGRFAKIQLDEGQTVTMWYTGEANRPKEGSANFAAAYWVLEPWVEVENECDDLAYRVFFTIPSQDRAREGPTGTFVLSGALLPQQALGVSWWPKEKVPPQQTPTA